MPEEEKKEAAEIDKGPHRPNAVICPRCGEIVNCIGDEDEWHECNDGNPEW